MVLLVAGSVALIDSRSLVPVEENTGLMQRLLVFEYSTRFRQGKLIERMAPIRLRVEAQLLRGQNAKIRVLSGILQGHARASRGALDLRRDGRRRAHQQPCRARAA